MLTVLFKLKCDHGILLQLEADMVNRISMLSKLTDCPVAVMSLSSKEAADVILRQRSNMLIPEVVLISSEPIVMKIQTFHLQLKFCLISVA